MAHEHLQTNPGFKGMLGRHPKCRSFIALLPKVATSKHPDWFRVKRAQGKETVAALIHADGPFRDRPFLLVDVPRLLRELWKTSFSVLRKRRKEPRRSVYSCQRGAFS